MIKYAISPEICTVNDECEVQLILSLCDGCSGLNDNYEAMEEVEEYMQEHFPDLELCEESECVYTASNISIPELTRLLASDDNMDEYDYDEFFDVCEDTIPENVMNIIYKLMKDDINTHIIEHMRTHTYCKFSDDNTHATLLINLNTDNTDYCKEFNNYLSYQIFIDVDFSDNFIIKNINECYVNEAKLENLTGIEDFIYTMINK